MEYPKECKPVLAQLEHVTETGIANWCEVVIFAGDKWRSFFGSNTFKDGEQVIKWKYTDECFGD